MNLKKSLFALATVIVLIYLFGAFFFMSHFMPNTFTRNYLQQYNISFEGEQILTEIIQKNDDAPFAVTLPDGTVFHFALKDFKNEETHKNDIIKILSTQNSFLWPIEMWKDKQIIYDDQYDVDEIKLTNLVNSFQLPEGEKAKNAYIDYQGNDFIVIQEKYGTEVDKVALYQCILGELNNGNNQDIVLDDSIYIQPEIKKDDASIKNTLQDINDMANRMISINLVDAEETIVVSQYVDHQALLENQQLIVDEEAVENLVKQLSEKYNTYNTKRLFTTHNGNQIYVGAENDGAADTYGFSLNQEETKEKIKEAIQNSDVTQLDAVWNMQGNVRDENGDIGNTYVEISIDEQHLWYFVDGELFLDTPIVTGLATQSRHTPKGVYGIYSKAREINLVGEMDGESWDSFVNYWMSITWNEIGIHDAPWRYNFGGNIYQYDGSHGCINLPYDAERLLYENTEMNTCVIVY